MQRSHSRFIFHVGVGSVLQQEFQNFATESFATILSEARKYGLALTLAHQYIDQVDEETRGAIFGNVGNLLSFRVGTCDIEVLAEEFGKQTDPIELTRLPRFTALIRTTSDGTPQQSFTMKTNPSTKLGSRDRSYIMRRASNHRYAKPQSQVMQLIEAAYAV